MVGAQKPLAGIFVAAAVVLYMVGAQKPPEIGNTRINTIIHDKVIISSYHHIFNKRRLPHTLLPILTIPNKKKADSNSN